MDYIASAKAKQAIRELKKLNLRHCDWCHVCRAVDRYFSSKSAKLQFSDSEEVVKE